MITECYEEKCLFHSKIGSFCYESECKVFQSGSLPAIRKKVIFKQEPDGTIIKENMIGYAGN
ncbi:MAG: hypothetical protein PHO27_12030 [Sulfuricurvum sp.]|jgi:hypothetical protein|nr:hypothetical protein [Sulfuricurvum sp.]